MRVASRGDEVALLCNPQAGGRWRVLADVLDREEAKSARRIVTDDIDDVREAIAGLGQRVRLLCIYGGDGTIFRVINELLRDRAAPPPRLAFLGGGTMNVTAGWCGMRHSPGENLRRVVQAYRADRLLWRDVPVLAVTQQDRAHYGFTFSIGPLVRILERFEELEGKSRRKAIELALKSMSGALSGIPRAYQTLVSQLEARLTVDGHELPYDRFAAVFANVTGTINPFIEPFAQERTRETFHFLSYAVSSREFAMMTPLLARGLIPIDARALLHPVSTFRRGLLALGKVGLPADPRYINCPARHLIVETAEPRYTVDGEVFSMNDRRIDLRLGPQLQLATLRARTSRMRRTSERASRQVL